MVFVLSPSYNFIYTFFFFLVYKQYKKLIEIYRHSVSVQLSLSFPYVSLGYLYVSFASLLFSFNSKFTNRIHSFGSLSVHTFPPDTSQGFIASSKNLPSNLFQTKTRPPRLLSPKQEFSCSHEY